MPPAFSTAAIAAFDAPATSIVIAALDLAVGQQAHPVAEPAQYGRDQRLAVEGIRGGELAEQGACCSAAGFTTLKSFWKILLLKLPRLGGGRRCSRGLAALEPVEGDAGARGLAFAAAARGLALAQADAAPDPLGGNARPDCP